MMAVSKGVMKTMKMMVEMELAYTSGLQSLLAITMKSEELCLNQPSV